jgi:2-oxoglutarate dehydrogenase E2 component (dihydrolipoamide succinyltransferase)
VGDTPPQRTGTDGRFYSPLVRSIAKEEGISQEELERIPGTGAEGRLTKNDLMDYVSRRNAAAAAIPQAVSSISKPVAAAPAPAAPAAPTTDGSINAGEIRVQWPEKNVEVLKMDGTFEANFGACYHVC